MVWVWALHGELGLEWAWGGGVGVLKLRFREVKVNGRDLLQYKDGSKYAVLTGLA